MNHPPAHATNALASRRAIFPLAVTVALAGCQTFEPPGGPLRAQTDAPDAVVALQRVNERALACWIRSGDRAFRALAVVPELDTRTGDPRILIVDRDGGETRPKLVITASGDPVEIETFGPLTEQRLSGRINQDVLAWSAGRTACT